MKADIRDTARYRETEALYHALRGPGTGQFHDAAEIHVSPDGKHAVFAGSLADKLEGVASTRIGHIDLTSGSLRVLTFGPSSDRLPRYSPQGRQVAFLSDRDRSGDFQLYLLDPISGAARSAPRVEGWIELLQWSPDGQRILLGVAGHGADISGGQGAVTSAQTAHGLPAWMPEVQTGTESFRWRSVWVYELATHRVERVSRPDSNIWESAWCGNDALVSVVSPGPGEGLWYTARLCVTDIKTGDSREIYTPRDQIGWPSASPSGELVAIVEAICSDRWLVAGDLRVIQRRSGRVQRVDTRGVDITYTEWRSERHLLLAGHRGFETVVGLYDVTSAEFTELWASCEVAMGSRYATVSGINEAGDGALVGEGLLQAPEIAVIRAGHYQRVRSLVLEEPEPIKAIASAERVSWQAPDGLEIEGLLLRPKGEGPHPLVMIVHGGPVWHWGSRWLGRDGVRTLMLVKRGYAVFLPNPRGSSGRGQEFARGVVGDMGGADTYDYLSGLDHLIECGIADPKRLGVTGVSYGGFMTAWLVTQDPRFAAAVCVAPVTNQVTWHLISNIPHFVSLFLADTYTNPGGKYFQRSPIMHAHKARTPTLNICGALDRCTPPQEAMQFHNALLENGVESVLVTYPQEGHAIRKMPACIDCTARIVSWFEEFMPA